MGKLGYTIWRAGWCARGKSHIFKWTMGDFANYLADCLAELETDSEEERDFREQMRDPLAVEDGAGDGEEDHEGDGVPPEPAAKAAAKPAPPLAQANVSPPPALEDLARMLAKKKKERGAKREAKPLGDNAMLTPAEKDAQNRHAAKMRRVEKARRTEKAKATVKKMKKKRKRLAPKRALLKEKQRLEAAAKKARKAQRDKERQAHRERQQRERMALAMRDSFENPDADEEYDPYSFGFGDK